MSVAVGAGQAAGLSPRRARVERWAPGVRVIRTYQKGWLPRDVIAGIVLVALLVPQGMAYAELAGLPAITGPLHHDRVPRGLRVRGAVADPRPRPGFVARADDRRDDPAARRGQRVGGDRARGDARAARGGGHHRRGAAEAWASSRTCCRARSAPGYLAGLAVVIFIGQLPKLFGFSTDADGLVAEAGLSPEPGPDQPLGAGGRDWARWSPSCCSGGSCRRCPASCSRSSGRSLLSMVAGPGGQGRRYHRRAAPGLPDAEHPGRAPRGHPAAHRCGAGHLAGGDRRHHLALRRVRDARRLRGGRQPGAGGHRHRERGGRHCSAASR